MILRYLSTSRSSEYADDAGRALAVNDCLWEKERFRRCSAGGWIGAGWIRATPRFSWRGALDGQRAVFTPAAGKRKYLAKLPASFPRLQVPSSGQKE